MRESVARTGIPLLTLICVPLIAGVYGILHDQLTYSISDEYYMRFKFIQFRFWTGALPAQLANPRLAVCAVGFLATWWTGIIIGPCIAMTGLIHRDARVMLKTNFKAIGIVLIITLLTGLIGLPYGGLHLANTAVSWPIPEGLVDRKHFIMVGSMHNFSYLGGLFGLIGGIIYHFVVKYRTKRIASA